MAKKHKPEIKQITGLRKARLSLEDGTFWSADVGTTLETYFKHAYPHLIPATRDPAAEGDNTIIAAVVNGRLRELTFPIHRDAIVAPVLLSDSDGLRIYRRSLSFVLVVAAEELFPDRKIQIDHSLPFGGYYCQVIGGTPFSEKELQQIKEQMQAIIDASEPITRQVIPLNEARESFTRQTDEDKVRLLKSRTKDYLAVYELRGVRNYFFGYMVPDTGYLTVFDLTHDDDGFILHFPRRTEPTRLRPISSLPKLRSVFKEAGRWLELLGIEDIGALNEAIREGRSPELILVSEALHEGRMADIADAIVERQPDTKLVLVAGPSSSGKTTSSKRLAIQLMAHGMRPFTLGLDNYFVDRHNTPLDENGDLDFEHLHAVDLDLFNQDLLDLIDGKEVQLPHYDFYDGSRSPGKVVRLTQEHIIIVEGIHALNPELVQSIPEERMFRLYVSCLTQLNIDRHNRIPTTDVRLLRRVVRDDKRRGYSALDTLSRWPSVRAGERKWIFPYQENADMMFNTALVYELAMLRPMAEPLLRQIEPDSPRHIEAKRLLSFLSWVEPLREPDLVPANSLLREFVGGGILEDYVPGETNIISHRQTKEAAQNGVIQGPDQGPWQLTRYI